MPGACQMDIGDMGFRLGGVAAFDLEEGIISPEESDLISLRSSFNQDRFNRR